MRNRLKFLVSSVALMACQQLMAGLIPMKLVNNSCFSDADIYVAIIGKRDDTGIYYNLGGNNAGNSALSNLNTGCNTLHKEAGDRGYANVFTRLSDIPDKTVYIDRTHACRMFFSFNSPMYLHVNDDNGGYAGADMQNPSDPNLDIRWEIIEFTYDNNNVMFVNTTRVDGFQYPMGVELWGGDGANNPYMKRGEIAGYEEVINRWKSQLAGTPYYNCMLSNVTRDNLGPVIMQPSKVAAVKNAGLFDDYINRIWSAFRSKEINVHMGVLGYWKGTVSGDDFNLYCYSGERQGQTALVRKPTSIDVIEGAGQFACYNGSPADLPVQAMFCGAMNRGVINTTLGSGELQDWGVTENFFKIDTCNPYVKFFHQSDLSHDGYTYAFAYDDTYDQSATCATSNPSHCTVTIGGFAGTSGGGGGGTVVTPGKPGMGGVWKIRNRNSGKYLDLENNSSEANTPIVQWDNEGEDDTQFWVLSEVESGVYSITSLTNPNRGFDVAWGSADNGTQVLLYDYQGGNHQKFRLVDMGDGYYQIIACCANKPIEIPSSSTSNGEWIKLYDNNGTDTQQWSLEKLPNPACADLVTFYVDRDHSGNAVSLGEGEYSKNRMVKMGINDNDMSSLKVMKGWKVTAFDGENFDGASVTYDADNSWIGDEWNDRMSSFVIIPNGKSGMSGKQRLQNRNSNKYFDLENNATDNGTHLIQYDDEGSDPSQLWILTETEHGVYRIAPSGDGSKALEVKDASKENSAEIHLNDYAGEWNQQFVLYPSGDAYQLVARNSGRVIEIPESKTGNGEWAKLWENNGTDTQHWYLRTPTGVEEIAAPATEGGMAEVYDLTGRMVKTVDASRPDYSGIPAGIYIIRTAGRAVKVAVK